MHTSTVPAFAFERPVPMTGIGLGVSTLLAGVALDKQQTAPLPDAADLLDGWALAAVNLLVLGPVAYAWAHRWLVPCAAWWRRALHVGGIVTVHAGLYAVVHKAMHKVAALRPIHRDHHRFQETVLPSAANAVSAQEFLLAYMTPFWAAARWLRPDPQAFAVAVGIVAACNLLVHAPHLTDASWPSCLVHPRDHLEHHRSRAPHYSAPTWSLHFLGL